MMTQEREAPAIYQALVDAAKDIGWVGKTGQNREQGYNFRGIDAVLQHVAPAFRRHGIIVVPAVADVEETEIQSQKGTRGYRVSLTVRFTFYCATDGSAVWAQTRGEGMDYSDKATNKAMSQAFKYALVQTLALPTDEPDGDSESPERVDLGKVLGEALTEIVGSKEMARAWAKKAANSLDIPLNALTPTGVERIVKWVEKESQAKPHEATDEDTKKAILRLLEDRTAFTNGTIPEIEQRVRVLYELMEAVGLWKGRDGMDALHAVLKDRGFDHLADVGKKADLVAFAIESYQMAVTGLQHPTLKLITEDDDAE